MQVPAITTEQMIEVDRLMIEEYGIQLIQMMENAGRNLAELSRQMLGGNLSNKRIAVVCGAGNNGGGGMAAARHLHNWGAEIALKIIAGKEKLKNIPEHQFHSLEAMGILDREDIDFASIDLVIDAMIGYGLTGSPQGATANWIRRINAAACPVLALDAPSGLNTTSGIPANPCIRATATMTLALPKIGLTTPQAKPLVGDLYLADIGVPPGLYAKPSLGITVGPLFIDNTIRKIER